MAFAVRLGDITAHGGVISGPGVPNVLIGGMPAAVVGDIHVCSVHPPTPFAKGSATVFIGGRPALRAEDFAACGAQIVIGATTVLIGG